ncbi:septum formation initiator [Corynebacterium lizhenjunii]|uniref:Septum formation initiator n=1 Tax=Corynebacterium lizhenjunii TaxID=2709394 RepID=A0A7T0KFH1_9CORY|nr:septum site-determining protein Ssd [Corynebacterium lizhenjunii]QPK79345.1 septum formation initiator [Corynebacterium lizhenjunii]
MTTQTLPSGTHVEADKAFILLALSDPVVTPEAAHAAAATGAEVYTCADPRDIARLIPRARVVIADAATAALVADQIRARERSASGPGGGTPCEVFFVAPEPGPLDYEAALRCHARAAFLLPAEAGELLAALAEAVHNLTPSGSPAGSGTHRRLAVLGACGGAGSSTLAASLARTWAQYRAHGGVSAGGRGAGTPGAGGFGECAAVLIDCHPHAGGLDLMLGIEEHSGVRWPELNIRGGSLDAADIVQALPATSDGIRVLSGARSTVEDPFVLRPQLLETISSALRDTPVVLDGLPVGGAETHEATPTQPGQVRLEQADHVVLLVPAEVRAVAAASTQLARIRAHGVAHSVVVRHRGWSSLDVADVEHVLHADVTAEIPHLRSLPKHIELGGLPLQLPRAVRNPCELIFDAAGWQL